MLGAFWWAKSGGVLLSQGVSTQVPSALAGLTSVFGMGTGVTPPLSPPKSVVLRAFPLHEEGPLEELHSEHEHQALDAKLNQALGRLVPVS